MRALCSRSASVGRFHLPTAFFISSVPCAAASAGLAQHLTSCRAGPGRVCSASVSPPTAAESLGLLPVCTCEPPWHCPCPTGPCPLPRTVPCSLWQVCSLPDHGSLAPGTTHRLLVSRSWCCSLEPLSLTLAFAKAVQYLCPESAQDGGPLAPACPGIPLAHSFSAGDSRLAGPW